MRESSVHLPNWNVVTETLWVLLFYFTARILRDLFFIISIFDFFFHIFSSIFLSTFSFFFLFFYYSKFFSLFFLLSLSIFSFYYFSFYFVFFCISVFSFHFLFLLFFFPFFPLLFSPLPMKGEPTPHRLPANYLPYEALWFWQRQRFMTAWGGVITDALCFLLKAVSGKQTYSKSMEMLCIFNKTSLTGLTGREGRRKNTDEPQVTQRDENSLWFNIRLMVKRSFVCQGFGTTVQEGTAWVEEWVYSWGCLPLALVKMMACFTWLYQLK